MPKRTGTPANWNALSILILNALLLSASSCNGTMPRWHGKIWAGHSATQSVRRTQEGQSFPTSDPRFDQGGWISYEDIRKLFDILQQCREWEKGTELVPVNVVLKDQALPILFEVVRRVPSDPR